MDYKQIKTLGQLKASGYESRNIKREVRDNLARKIAKKKELFSDIYGYENSVIPEVENALLAEHNILFLGLRGQAKTRMARDIIHLLDEKIPVIKGSEINDDPFNPVSLYAKEVIEEKGDDTPIDWLTRDQRYAEKLATPDVTVADLIGDADPIKAANLKLSYGDERIMHFGLVPRSNRGIFVINELPDLQPRIQVALFNILQEGDIQIRGFKVRMPLDILFVFTANPEDYTSRGSIVTPLKDRIESQIMTHYPETIETAMKITKSEARVDEDLGQRVSISPLLDELIEQISFEARESEYVDQKSGVSARLGIAARELLHASLNRRMLKNDEKNELGRISDLYQVVPAITGKVELVYEGEQEGAPIVARNLISRSIKNAFLRYFPDPEDFRKRAKDENPYKSITSWYEGGHRTDLFSDSDSSTYASELKAVEGLENLVNRYQPQAAANTEDLLVMMEFVLHGLSEFSMLSKSMVEQQLVFKDIMSGLFNLGHRDQEEDDLG